MDLAQPEISLRASVSIVWQASAITQSPVRPASQRAIDKDPRMLHPRANAMLAFALPALIIGSASSLVLILVMKFAEALQRLLWVNVPAALNIDTHSPGGWWAC